MQIHNVERIKVIAFYTYYDRKMEQKIEGQTFKIHFKMIKKVFTDNQDTIGVKSEFQISKAVWKPL